MAKTNYSKVEEILGKGLNKITVNKLLLLADVAAGMGDSDLAKAAKERVFKSKILHKRIRWISSIKRDLDFLYKKDKELYSQLNIERKQIHSILDKPNELDDKDWEFIEKLFHQIQKYKKEFLNIEKDESDEELIESERLKHINKRFNVNEKWLPLD